MEGQIEVYIRIFIPSNRMTEIECNLMYIYGQDIKPLHYHKSN